MEIQQLKGFLAVASSGSFSAAARITHRTQPAISIQIKSLEGELGVTLFERYKGKVHLTSDGEALRKLAAPLVEDFKSLESRFREIQGEQSGGKLSIATHASVMTYLLPQVVRRYKAELPKVELKILNRGPEDIVQMVRDREIDLGITYVRRPPKIIHYEVIARFRRILIGSKNHPLSKKKRLSLQDIAEYPLILPPKGSNTRRKIQDTFASNELPLNLAMEIFGRESVKSYVKMGLGLSVLNEYYIPQADRSALFSKDVTHYFGQAERGVVTYKNRELPFAVTRFIEILRQLSTKSPSNATQEKTARLCKCP